MSVSISADTFPKKAKESIENNNEMFDTDDAMLSSDEWSPSAEEYTPGFTKEQWMGLLNSKKIIGPIWGGVLAAFYAEGGAATCTQIARKYHKTAPQISGYCTNLAMQ